MAIQPFVGSHFCGYGFRVECWRSLWTIPILSRNKVFKILVSNNYLQIVNRQCSGILSTKRVVQCSKYCILHSEHCQTFAVCCMSDHQSHFHSHWKFGSVVNFNDTLADIIYHLSRNTAINHRSLTASLVVTFRLGRGQLTADCTTVGLYKSSHKIADK